MNTRKNDDTKLLLKPRPFAGESLAGYQLRVAEANGYSSGLWLSRHFLGTPRITISSPEHASRVSSMLGLSPEELDRLAYIYDDVPPGGYFRYFGQELHQRHIKLKYPAVCPHCLKERAATNGFWELKYAVACPFHGIRLIDSCQQCGKGIRWDRSKVCECPKCKFDYRSSLTEIAPPQVMELIRLLYSTANISLPAEPSNNSGFGMPLAVLKSESLNTLIFMISFISRHLWIDPENTLDHMQAGYLNRLSREYQDVLKAAYFLSEWPERLIDGTYMKITSDKSKTSYLKASYLLVGMTRPKMPQLFQQIGNAFIESATLLHGTSFRVDNRTLENTRLRVSTCF